MTREEMLKKSDELLNSYAEKTRLSIKLEEEAHADLKESERLEELAHKEPQ